MKPLGQKKREIALLEDRGVRDFAITRRRRESGFFMADLHCHSYYELFYLAEGSCRMFIDHSIYYVVPGDVVLIEPNRLHRTMYEASPVTERVGVFFSRKMLRQMEQLCGEEGVRRAAVTFKTGVPPGSCGYLEELFRKMENEAERPDGYSDMLKAAYLMELLAFLERNRRTEPDLPQKLDEGDAAVQKAAGYMYYHYNEPLSLERMADMVHMSPTYFSKKFRRVAGVGFKEYLGHIRIEAAARQLVESDGTVTEIAVKCGYSDGNYFGDAFRKARGMSPNQYRKAARDQTFG